jgi:hypothetical protein
LPEIWLPYGRVESLVTVQAENLGAVVQPEPEKATVDAERYVQAVREAKSLFICDSAPSTFELVRDLLPAVTASTDLKLYSAAPKRLEGEIADLKGKVATLPPPLSSSEEGAVFYAPELTSDAPKVFVGTARPDPLFGIVDARVLACLSWVERAHSIAAQARTDMEPTPFVMTESYEKTHELAEKVPAATFLTVVPRGGKVRSVMENAPFDAVKNGFFEATAQPAKGLIVGAGGWGHDDTLSSAVRGIWGALLAARRTGTVLVVAECAAGLGSPALEMLATGRLGGDVGKRKEKYVDGLEEIFYLNKLKEDFDVLLLCGLPEVYAKSKLGLNTAKGSGEGVGRLLNKVGRSGKVNVVARGPECRIVSG